MAPRPACGLLAAPRLRHLRDTVRREAEDRPGVYGMWGPSGEPLYVGKSVRLRSRLLSYFRAEPGEKPFRILRDTHRVAWEYVPNEFSALLREMRLIQRHRPRYNVVHVRRRGFVFAKITSEAVPKLLAVSRAVPDGSVYFGPFPRPRFVAEALRDLTYVLGLRDCPGPLKTPFSDQLAFLEGLRRPGCLRAEVGSCSAPCVGGCTSREYRERLDQARRFLEGSGGGLLLSLERAMEEAAGNLRFEYAAALRDRLFRLQDLHREVADLRSRGERLSFVYRLRGFRGSSRLYLIRGGLVEAEFPCPKGQRARERAARLVRTIFQAPPRPPERMGPDAAAEIFLVAGWFHRRPSETTRTMSPDAWLARFGPTGMG